jgi:hypothetical protein
MSRLCSNSRPLVTRRDMLTRSALGIGGLGLATLLQDAGYAGDVAIDPAAPLAARSPQFTPRARRVIQIFCEGGPSQVDSFDPKPALQKYNGQSADEAVKEYQKTAGETAAGMGRLSGKLTASPFAFSRHGECGMEISELFPRLAGHADKLCVVRSMQTSSSVHELAQMRMNTGDFASVRPSVGAWAVYGLGCENANLPAFVALSQNGSAPGGDRQWGNAFLPAWASGTGIPTQDFAVTKMIEHVRSGSMSLREQRRQLDLLRSMHERFLKRKPEAAIVEGRVQAFETAFRMQVEATDAFDLAREPKRLRARYGDTFMGKQCLLARRLVESGVRFVQLWHNGWDTHDKNDEQHRKLAEACDGPVATLLADLSERGMLDDTLVIWGGEFGRTPTADTSGDVSKKQGKDYGRDHNAGGFTIWMAGGGTKGGTVYGTTDDFGALAVENPVDVHDLHATILHLLGFDHERLTFRYAGRDFRLTDVHGHVVRDLLA